MSPEQELLLSEHVTEEILGDVVDWWHVVLHYMRTVKMKNIYLQASVR